MVMVFLDKEAIAILHVYRSIAGETDFKGRIGF